MVGIMTYGQTFFGWLLQTTLIASVVICLILLIQKMLGGKLGPRWCHALWLVLLIRMILPWAPSSRVSLLNLIPSWDRQVQRVQSSEATEQQLPSQVGQAYDTAEAIPARKSESDITIQKQAIAEPGVIADMQIESQPWLVSLRRVLPVLWLAGAIVIGVYLLVSNFALWRIVKRDRPLVNQSMLELFEECKTQMGVQSLVVVVPSSQIRSPALFGFIRPRLLLPSEMLEKASHEEMRYVFLHELAHLRRHDIYVGWLTSLLQVLHWFNPLIWFAFYIMRADRELACDALVLARTQKEESQEYGQAIVGLVRRFSRSRPLPAMAGILESKSQLKRRIAMIAQFKKNSYNWSPLAVILIIMLGCVSLPDAQHKEAAVTSAAKPSPGTKAAPNGKPEVTVRQVWSFKKLGEGPQSDNSGAPSPDGRHLSFTNWSYGNLAVRDLTTGEYRDLTDEGTWDGPDQWTAGSIWSPDGKQIAYSWYNEYHWELRIVGLDGSEQRVLYSNKEMKARSPNGIRPFTWSQDGKYILARFYKKPGPDQDVWEIALVSVADGSVRILKSLKGLRQPSRHCMSLSPNGRYVVYARKVEEDKIAGDIFLLATDGSGEEMLLVEHPADDYGPVWAPDGKTIVFVSDRSGAYDTWLMHVADGKPVGEPQLVKRDTGVVQPMGFTREGSLYYGLSTESTDVYVASIDPATGKLLAQPSKAIRSFEGFNSSPAWSPDGKSLAYVSERPSPGSSRRRRVLVIRSVETGQERELYPEARLQYLCWSPDGGSILCGRSLQLIDVQSGDVTRIVQFDPTDEVEVGEPEWSPDGKAIFYGKATGNSLCIVAHDLKTGKAKEFCRDEIGGAGLAISPDGQQLAFIGKNNTIKVVPAVGGEPHELLRLQDGEVFAGLFGFAWSADGRHILYRTAKLDQPELWALCRVPAEGGQPQKLMEMVLLEDISVHPDGRRIAFSGGWEGTEVWAMEKFLPKSTTGE